MKKLPLLLISLGLAVTGVVVADTAGAPPAQAVGCAVEVHGGNYAKARNQGCFWVMAMIDYRSSAGNLYQKAGPRQPMQGGYSQTVSIYTPNTIVKKYETHMG